MGAGSYPFQKLFSRSHFAIKLGMPFVAGLQQDKLSFVWSSFCIVDNEGSNDWTHKRAIGTEINILYLIPFRHSLH
jgi:hypothetical protein